jgi:hypothetical protein
MEWMAAIAGDRLGLFLDFSPRKKICGDHFPGRKWMTPGPSVYTQKYSSSAPQSYI